MCTFTELQVYPRVPVIRYPKLVTEIKNNQLQKIMGRMHLPYK